MVATRRPAPPAPALDAALAAVDAAGSLRARLELRPLAEEEVARLVARAEPGLGEDAARQVVAAAAGNPLLAREAGRAAAAGRAPADGLRDWVRGPLRSLDGAARSLVELAAAGGRPLEMAEAADLVGAGQLADAVDEGVAAGLLEAAGRRVGFGHDLVREACYAELGAPRALAAHARLAEVLARRPGRRAAEVARHLRRADDAEGAARWLAEAAQEARALGALDEAAAYLAEAAGLAAGDAAREAELWLALADVHAWRADLDAMEAAAASARALMEARGDEAGLALLDASRSRWLRTTLCVPGEALAASRAALARIDAAGLAAPEARLLALVGAAWSESVAGDPAAVPEIVRTVRMTPEAMGDRALEAELEHARGTALMRAGDHAAAGAHLRGRRRPGPAGRAARPGGARAADGRVGRRLRRGRGAGDRIGRPVGQLAMARRVAGGADAGGAGARAGAPRPPRRGPRGGRGQPAPRRGRHGARPGARGARHGRGAPRRGRGAAGAPPTCARRWTPPAAGIPRALARLRLAEALAAAGDAEGAEAELERVALRARRPRGHAGGPGPADRAGAGGDRRRPRRPRPRRAPARRGGRLLGPPRRDGRPRGTPTRRSLVNLGRPPVAGLVEPERERRAAVAARAALGAEEPVP